MQTNSANLPSPASSQPDTDKSHHIWLVTGPAGCGKSTVAEHLAKHLEMPYIEGDSVGPYVDSYVFDNAPDVAAYATCSSIPLPTWRRCELELP